MNSEQCRVARAMLGWSAKELSRQARVGERTILEFENRARKLMPKTSGKIRSLFIIKGIEFIDDDDGIGLKRRFNLDEYMSRFEERTARARLPEMETLGIDSTG